MLHSSYAALLLYNFSRHTEFIKNILNDIKLNKESKECLQRIYNLVSQYEAKAPFETFLFVFNK